MTQEEVISTARALYAQGAPGPSNISALLGTFSDLLGPEDSESWSSLFGFLSEGRHGQEKFEIILGIYDCLTRRAEKSQFEPVWLASIENAGIHPVSLVLCNSNFRGSKRSPFFQQYGRGGVAVGGIQIHLGFKKGTGISNGGRMLVLPPGEIISNVLSSMPLWVRDQTPNATKEIGEGWNVPSLTMGNMPHLTRIGPDQVVLEHLNLSKATAIESIGDGSRIGGKLKVWNSKYPGGTIQKKFQPSGSFKSQLGLSFEGRNCEYGPEWVEYSEQQWKDPIVLNDAWASLLYR
jgi:hypothetical protein